MSRKLVSVIAPAYNEAENLPLLVEEVKKAFELLPEYDFELVIAENASDDGSLDILKKFNSDDPRIRYVGLSRNFGHQGGIWAGLEYAKGDAIISMDADLQHPPSEIPNMVKEWSDGAQVVEMEKTVVLNTPKRRIINFLYYEFTDKISGLRLARGDFRLLDRKVLDHLLALPEKQKYLRGLVPWIGFRQVKLRYQLRERALGVSKFNPKQLIDFAFNGLTSFSVAPLRAMMNVGFLLLIPSVSMLIYFLIVGFRYLVFGYDQNVPPGWATLVVVITFFGSVQLLSVGILGEYIGKIFMESKDRPLFFVDESSETKNK